MKNRLKQVVVVSAFAGLFAPFAASAVDWTGLGDDNKWSTQANWSSDVPKSGEKVILDETVGGGNGNIVTVDVDTAAIGDIEFKGSQSYLLTSAEGRCLNVNGKMKVYGTASGASLTISGKASFSDYFCVGYAENVTGVVHIVEGADLTVKNMFVGGSWIDSRRAGIVYQTGGDVVVTDAGSEGMKLCFGGNSYARYVLSGGTLTIPFISGPFNNPDALLALDGGVLRAYCTSEDFVELLQIVDERGCTAPFVYNRSSSS